MRRFRMILALLMTLLIGLLTVGVALGYDEDDDKDDNGKTYSVTVTNLTKRQVLTPPLLISHDWSYHLFMAGKPANEKLAVLAESGDYKPLMIMLRDNDKVFDLMAGEAIPR